MVKIRMVSTKGNLFSSFEASGHAGISEKGKDIICSAITTLLKTAIFTLKEAERNNNKLKVKVIAEKSGYLSAIVKQFGKKDEPRLKYLFEFLVLGLMSIKTEYSDYLDLKIESND